MPIIEYQKTNFRQRTLEIIETANSIIEEYQAESYDLTLRQLYYQFIARDLFPEGRRWKWTGKRWIKDPNGTKNAPPNYKWLGTLINDGRLAGLIDWNSIVERTRQHEKNSHWDSPAEIIASAAEGYGIDTRVDQDLYIEVWVEKDALISVIERACQPLDVGYFSCRGYVSQSAMWRAACRITKQIDRTYYESEMMGLRNAVVLHLGDHDPSGINMTEDIQNRLDMFGAMVNVVRIALNKEQVEKYQPPPNPVKQTDSRSGDYEIEYGDECWELDALDPRVITKLIEKHVQQRTDQFKRDALIEKQEADREKLQEISDNLQGEL